MKSRKEEFAGGRQIFIAGELKPRPVVTQTTHLAGTKLSGDLPCVLRKNRLLTSVRYAAAVQDRHLSVHPFFHCTTSRRENQREIHRITLLNFIAIY